MALPCLAFDPGRPPSSSPATPAAATAPANPAPPVPPPLRSLHQEPPYPPVNPSPYSILIGNPSIPKHTLLPRPPPPRSSPPAAPSVPTYLATTGRIALEWRIHPRPLSPAGSRRSPATIAVASPPPGTEKEEGEDWSNLTSGPPGPTVSDLVSVHVVKWRRKASSTPPLYRKRISI